MSILRSNIRIEGVGLDKLLVRLQEDGFVLFDLKRISNTALALACNANEYEKLHEQIVSRGFSVTVLPAQGLARTLQRLRAQLALIFLTLLLIPIFLYALSHIWYISIEGAGPYKGEVRTYLREEGIHVGMTRSQIDIDTLCSELSLRLPNVAWVHAEHRGLALAIDVTLGTPAPQLEDEAGNIVAKCDGIIKSISVYAGTPAVAVGDTVQAGDVLIYGYERRENETDMPVHAQGKILAHTYIQESAIVSGEFYHSERTGRAETRYVITLPSFRFSFSAEPAYLTSESESQRLPLSLAWVPVTVEKETIYEVALSHEKADEEQLKSESGRLAMQKLLLRCSRNDEIIDKWLDYSMIEGGNILATAIAEIRTDIAQFSPQTPD